ncbi:4-amino-4-deoxy-L-arabinose transferase [Shimia gijangensis]|uniref:4-amino-4-deoxy-L-arabinose transferase n=1 Tax=Shimia gijangensis TaxID=1470563 RepID=A0A1M6TWF1_9RHOB|nr:4-amino-4-deoxy-L-arabinose transferase [Shimia gijangensis]
MKGTRNHASAALIGLLCVSAIMINYHDQFWWPVDEGIYAYVAQRANAGDVIHRDFIDLHAGYGNLLNALAFRVFGEDLLSLRYPLIAFTVLQCIITFVLLKDSGAAVALVGVIVVAAFSFVQFPNPSANWHALVFFFCLCLCLEKIPRGSFARLLLAGTLVGLCFFTRQLSGVFLALGLVCVLLAEAPREKEEPRAPAILIGGVSIVGLSVYLASKQHLFGLIWGGIWPLGLLMLATLRARTSWSYVGQTVGLVTLGFGLAGLPLVLWALSNGAFSYWASDIFLTAMMINGQDFISQASFLTILQMAWQNIISPTGFVSTESGIAWVFLILSVPALGIKTNSYFYRFGSVRPVTIMAVFWAIGALHYQILIYLLFALPAVLIGLLVMQPTRIVMATLIVVSGWALVFQAGQPLERGVSGVVAGNRSVGNIAADIPRVSLQISPSDAALYRQVIEIIETTAISNEQLMTIPMEPELNFITGRKSPVRYYGTPLGLRTESDVRDTIAALDAAAPLFVINRRNDKYLTRLSAQLLELVKARSEDPVRIGPFDFYRYQASLAETASAPEQ